MLAYVLALVIGLGSLGIYMAAFFFPDAIAGRARRYNFTSDASHRFERGVDFENNVAGIERPWFIRFFGMRKGGAIIPHVHNNMVSSHLVIDGQFHARTFDRMVDLPDEARGDATAIMAALDDPAVWTVTCFVVRKGFRKQGLMYELAAATVEYGRQVGARVLEGYPTEQAPGRTVIWDEASVGLLQVFLDAGYEKPLKVLRRRHDSGLPATDLSLQRRRLEQKFRAMVTPVLGAEGCNALLGLVGRLEELPDLSPLAGVLAGRPLH